MPAILDGLRERGVNFSAEIYCNCAPTQDAQANEAFANQLRQMPNITHVGMVGQGALAQRMKAASVLVMPNPWPETSCITMIEAMAVGLHVVSSNRGALPETAAGYAHLISVEDAGHPTRFDMPMPIFAFVDAVEEALKKSIVNSDDTKDQIKNQMDYFKSNYQWQQRVQPWVEYLRTF